MTATIAELERQVNRLEVTARSATNAAAQANERSRKDSERLERVEGKVDALIGDVRALGAMRPKLDSLAALDLTGLSEGQARAAKRRMLVARLGKLARRAGSHAAVAFAGVLAIALALALLSRLGIHLPPELVHP